MSICTRFNNKIVIAFPKMEAAANIRKILSQSGYSVAAVCTTGAKALQVANDLEQGILICGYRFVDMAYSEIYEYLPNGFEMLLVASASNVMEKEEGHLVCLSMPLKVHELLDTIEMMDYQMTRRKKRQRQRPKERSEEEQQLILQAKTLLMERNQMSEEEAHRYIQKRSMENGTGLVEISQMIISLMGN